MGLYKKKGGKKIDHYIICSVYDLFGLLFDQYIICQSYYLFIIVFVQYIICSLIDNMFVFFQYEFVIIKNYVIWLSKC